MRKSAKKARNLVDSSGGENYYGARASLSGVTGAADAQQALLEEPDQMAMSPFYTRFRDLAFREMRTAFIHGRSDIPDGEYGFLELYCDELDCDCRRVTIDVVSRATGSKIWATISYGWETPAYYAAWSGDKEAAKNMAGAELDPLNPQTRCSRAFLRLFKHILEDQAYVDRLKRHYQMFKEALRQAKPLDRENLDGCGD